MNYLVTYSLHGMQYAEYRKSFNTETDFDCNIQMIVFDLINEKYMVNSLGWVIIKK